jgi:Protein of unknown function (DUF3467)
MEEPHAYTEKAHAPMSETEREQQTSYNITLPIEWHVPDSIQSRYATNVVVQPGQYEFILSFFETQLPIFMGQPEENRAKLEQIGAVQAVCVGRIIVAAEQLPGIIDALQTVLDAYRASQKARE